MIKKNEWFETCKTYSFDISLSLSLNCLGNLLRISEFFISVKVVSKATLFLFRSKRESPYRSTSVSALSYKD